MPAFATGVMLVTLALAAAACGASLKHIEFPVKENGQSVQVSKFFNDGFGGTEATKAFEAAQRGDVPAAIAILNEDIARHPTFAWNHYDLAILYESTASWDKAEAEIKEAQRVEGPKGASTKSYADELAYILAHKGK